MASTASFHITDGKDAFLEQDAINTLQKELENYLKCVKGNTDRMFALTDIMSVDASKDNAWCCETIPNWRITDNNGKCVGGVGVSVMKEIIRKMNDGQKVNGKDGQWSCGFMGSRWCDLDAEKYGLDYVRCAFYSKKTFKGEWRHNEPYAIIITCEKARE